MTLRVALQVCTAESFVAFAAGSQFRACIGFHWSQYITCEGCWLVQHAMFVLNTVLVSMLLKR
jgi:hypothetical protein